MGAGDQYDTVRTGEKFHFYADVYNDLMRMRRDWKQGRIFNAQPTGDRATPTNPAAVLVQNPGADCPMFGVLAIDSTPAAIPIDPSVFLQGFQTNLILSGETPQVGDDVLAFAVALESIASGFVGRAAISGAVQVQIQVTSDTDGLMCAGPLPGDNTQLQLVPGGFKVLWIEEYDDEGDDPQTLWGIVQLGLPEGIVTARQDASQDGTHPVGTTRLYDLLSGPYAGQTPPVTALVLNQIKSVSSATGKIAYITGQDGQYVLLAIDPCSD